MIVKFKTIISALALLITSISHAAMTDELLESKLDNDAKATLALISESRGMRNKLPQFINEATEAIKTHKGALPSKYAKSIIDTLALAEQQRDGLFKQALSHRGALYRVDGGIEDKMRVNEIIIAMSAAVTLFENNKIMRKSFSNSELLRSKLNEGYPEFGISSKFYDSSMARAAAPEYVKSMTDAIRYFRDNKSVIASYIAQSTPTVQSLFQVVAESPVLKDFHKSNVFKEIVLIPFKATDNTVALTKYSLGRIKYTTSKVAGNTMGMVRWRDGKLKNDKEVLNAMLAQLQPGDILLEKTPFTLTDKSIPGHFGHAAIYTGTVEQLKTINALNLPMVKKNLDKISAGHAVVEALRNGVQLDTLPAFMNIDDVAILRLKNVTAQQQAESVNLALANLGKKYDFNFDVNTTDTIVCSELVYIAYPQVDFVTKNVLGSFTVSPDDIAQRAGSTSADPLEVVFFAHDGQLVCAQNLATKDKGLALYDKLVKPKQLSSSAQQKNEAFEGFLHQQ